MQKQRFAFGKHCIAIEADDHLSEALCEYWRHYRIQEDRGACAGTIFIETGLHSSTFNRNAHWQSSREDAATVATFYNNRLALFAIRYTNNSSTMHLSLRDDNHRTLLLGLQHAVMLTLSDHCIGLHCATVICGSQSVALSAPSGTGKTTLANLLSKYCEGAIVNGDFALISVDEQYGVMFEPTPFCGTSRICFNVRLPLHRVVFLSQAEENRMEQLDAHTALQNLLSNVFVPEWDL